MKKMSTKKERQKMRENIFFGVLIGALILVVVLAVVELVTKDETVEVVVTADGHVHTTDGAHLGTVEEIFGEEASSLFTTADEQTDAGEAQAGDAVTTEDEAQ